LSASKASRHGSEKTAHGLIEMEAFLPIKIEFATSMLGSWCSQRVRECHTLPGRTYGSLRRTTCSLEYSIRKVQSVMQALTDSSMNRPAQGAWSRSSCCAGASLVLSTLSAQCCCVDNNIMAQRSTFLLDHAAVKATRASSTYLWQQLQGSMPQLDDGESGA